MTHTKDDNYIKDAMGPTQKFFKRLIDFFCALFGLLILSPLFLVIIISLKVKGSGVVFFSQERIGYKGRPFTIYKFKTMSSKVEENGPCLISDADEIDTSKVEKFIRKHHLDELPQLWNLLKGNMSLVGPRPERKYFIDKIIESGGDYDPIYLMKPGLTSNATLYNGYTDTIEKMLVRLKMDTEYLRTRSLYKDFKIIAKTVFLIISGKKF